MIPAHRQTMERRENARLDVILHPSPHFLRQLAMRDWRPSCIVMSSVHLAGDSAEETPVEVKVSYRGCVQRTPNEL